MSSVRKGQRRKSSIDYNHAFNKLNDDIIRFMLKDFGNKNVIKDPIIYARHKVKLSEEDQMLFDNICKMMGASMEVSYPGYILEYYRKLILDTLASAQSNIVHAHSVRNPYSVKDYYERRSYQVAAIGDIETLSAQLLSVLRLFYNYSEKNKPVVEKYMWLTDEVDEVHDSLVYWKKRCNKQYNGCAKNDRLRQARIDDSLRKDIIYTGVSTFRANSIINEINELLNQIGFNTLTDNETSKVRLLKEKYDDTYGVPEYNKSAPDDHDSNDDNHKAICPITIDESLIGHFSIKPVTFDEDVNESEDDDKTLEDYNGDPHIPFVIVDNATGKVIGDSRRKIPLVLDLVKK